jgi:hypothetical protein
VIEWLRNNETALWCLGGVSILTFLGSLIVVPLLVVRIPADYFSRRRRRPRLWASQHPVVRAVLVVGKNILGVALVGGGIIMLFLPGPGTLTILIGVTMLDFPGKFWLERWIVSRGPVLKSINWLRGRKGRGPLLLS